MEKYRDYTFQEFLNDEHFLRYILLSEQEDVEHWEDVFGRFPQLIEDANKARAVILTSTKFNSYKLSSIEVDNEAGVLLQNLKMRKQKKHRLLIAKVFSVAASVALLIFFINQFYAPDQKSLAFDIERSRLSSAEDVVLITRDSSFVLKSFSHVAEKGIDNLNLDSTLLELYSGKGHEIDTKSYNKLVVPYGKRSSLLLADGSRMWVNSGSVVEFPSQFDENSRYIRVDGEVYLEVVKDAKKKFIVSTPKFEVEVLGTTFNVSAYSTDANSHVVLVDGKVSVANGEKNTKMIPNQLYSQTTNGASLTTVDVMEYTSWRLGWLHLKSHSLLELSVLLSRYYNVNIQCEPNISKRTASGKLKLFDNVENVLETLSNNMNVNYRQEDKRIILFDTAEE